VQLFLLGEIAEGVAVDDRAGERGKAAHGVVGLRERLRLHVEHFRHHDIAVLGGVEPEHRVVAQADVVEADGEHHQRHGRDQTGLGHDQVARGQDILAFIRREQSIVLLADGNLRLPVRGRRRPVKRLDIGADLADRLGREGAT
jgi:hypothetical protein